MDITAERQRDADAYGKLCDAADEREREVEMFATDLVKFSRLGEMDISIHGNTRSKYVGNSVYAQTPEPIWQTIWEAVEADEKFQKRLMQLFANAAKTDAAALALLDDISKDYGDRKAEYK